MKKAKAIVSILLTCLISVSFTACTTKGGKADSKKITIKVATGGQNTLPSYAALLDVLKDIEEKSEGKVDIQYFGSRQLGDDGQILEQVMGGMVEIGGGGSSTFSTYTPALEALQLPFLLNDYAKEEKALKSAEVKALYNQIEEEYGIKILAIYDSGMRHLANNIRPIKDMKDLKGLKMRVVPSKMLLSSFSALGANPTPMAYGEVYTGLQNKVIDGEEINITSIYSEKHYEALKYFTEIGIYPFATAIYVNSDFFNSLDKDLQDIIIDSFEKGYDYNFNKYLPEAERAGIESMKKAGMQIDEITDVTPFQEKVTGIIEEYKKKDPLISDFIDMALKLDDEK